MASVLLLLTALGLLIAGSIGIDLSHASIAAAVFTSAPSPSR